MIVAAALMLTQAANVPTPPETVEEEREILVIGRRSSWWTGAWEQKDSVTTCTTRKSTGDAEIDKIMCDGLATCAPRYVPEMKSLVEARKAAGVTVTRENVAKVVQPATTKIMRCARSISRQPFLALIRARKAARK